MTYAICMWKISRADSRLSITPNATAGTSRVVTCTRIKGSSPSFGPGLSSCTIGQYPFFLVVFISQPKGPALNQLNLVVEALGHPVGVAMPNVARNRLKPPTERPRHALEGFQRALTR